MAADTPEPTRLDILQARALGQAQWFAGYFNRQFARSMEAVCLSCGTGAYTKQELNLHPGQDGRCYSCFDKARREPGNGN